MDIKQQKSPLSRLFFHLKITKNTNYYGQVRWARLGCVLEIFMKISREISCEISIFIGANFYFKSKISEISQNFMKFQVNLSLQPIFEAKLVILGHFDIFSISVISVIFHKFRNVSEIFSQAKFQRIKQPR